MPGWLRIVVAVAAALFIQAFTTIAALIGLNAECNGADCPRSDAWRATVVALPVVALILLLVGATWSASTRKLRPLVLAEAAVIALVPLVGLAFGDAGLSTVVWAAVAGLVGWRALHA